MRESTLAADWYLKAVLTIIAVALCLICLNPWIAPKDAGATNEVVPVRITGVDYNKVLPVKIMGVDVRSEDVPVTIKGVDMYADTSFPLLVKVTNWPR